jgi:tetrathionate reductase subunit B
VSACQRAGGGALAVGDLNDPGSEVSRLIRTQSVKRLREELGTEPKVFYVGL